MGSAKDRAENLMIVDLVRNDLGRVCCYGSVAVPELWRAEKHPGVWHLVSDVTGELREAVSDAELLRAAFPPGSVTGAPKVRAMELVAVLEGTDREVYTGAIGIAESPRGARVERRHPHFRAGRWEGLARCRRGSRGRLGPRTASSKNAFDKARPLLGAIGAELAPNRDHRGRLISGGTKTVELTRRRRGRVRDDACDRRPTDRARGAPWSLGGERGLPLRIAAFALSWDGGDRARRRGFRLSTPTRPRRTRRRAGVLQVRSRSWRRQKHSPARPGPAWALVPTVLIDGLGPHKWHDRQMLTARRDELGVAKRDQLLLIDSDGAVLETESANVFAVFGRVVRTPPLDGRILAGTTREVLIRVANLVGLQVSEEPFTLHETRRGRRGLRYELDPRPFGRGRIAWDSNDAPRSPDREARKSSLGLMGLRCGPRCQDCGRFGPPLSLPRLGSVIRTGVQS